MIDLTIDCQRVKQILTNFIRTKTQNAGFKRVVVGLSGGLDSSLSTWLAVEALGKQGVIGINMPYKTSSPESIQDAKLIASQLGISLITIDITPQIDAYFAKFPQANRIRRGNKMARERMAILYDQSRRHRALVLGTGNKTEHLLGYTTLWGDMACDLNPLGDLYKTQVYQLAAYVGIPDHIIKKVPSAELWAGQTDEGELGFTYEEVDCLLYALLDLKYSQKQLLNSGFEKSFINKVKKIIKTTQHKRHMPTIARI